MQRIFEHIALWLLCIAGVILIGFQLKPFGWIVLALSMMALTYCRPVFAKHLILVQISLGIVGLASIDTDIRTAPALTFTALLTAAVLFPFLFSKYVYKEKLISFPLRGKRRWHKKEVAYVALAGLIAFFVLPIYLRTGADPVYQNWPNVRSTGDILRLFIGTNALGIWDELFFVCTALAIFRRYFRFWEANLAQAVLFTAFLHELGFTGWIFILIYIFALLQGYIFSKTESLLYILAIHLTIDFILFLALVNAWNPRWVDIFYLG